MQPYPVDDHTYIHTIGYCEEPQSARNPRRVTDPCNVGNEKSRAETCRPEIHIYIHIVYTEKIKEGKQRGKREAFRAKKISKNCRKSMPSL